MVIQDPVDPNTVAALVARLGSDGVQIIDLRVEAHPALGGGAAIVIAANADSGGRRLLALAGEAAPGVGVRLDELVARLHAAGLAVRALHGTLEDPVTGAGDAAGRVPPEVVEWVRAQPGALVRDLVVLVEPGAPAEIPALVPAVQESVVRLVDAYTERAARDLRERREVLTVRDHVIGLEATASAAEDKALVRGNRLREVREKLERREAEVERLRARVRALESGDDDGHPASAVGRAARRLRR